MLIIKFFAEVSTCIGQISNTHVKSFLRAAYATVFKFILQML